MLVEFESFNKGNKFKLKYKLFPNSIEVTFAPADNADKSERLAVSDRRDALLRFLNVLGFNNASLPNSRSRESKLTRPDAQTSRLYFSHKQVDSGSAIEKFKPYRLTLKTLRDEVAFQQRLNESHHVYWTD